jgi:hypothetical protein
MNGKSNSWTKSIAKRFNVKKMAIEAYNNVRKAWLPLGLKKKKKKNMENGTILEGNSRSVVASCYWLLFEESIPQCFLFTPDIVTPYLSVFHWCAFDAVLKFSKELEYMRHRHTFMVEDAIQVGFAG